MAEALPHALPHERVYLPGETCSIGQAAAIAGVSRRTLYNWIAQGRVTRLVTPSGNTRLIKAELLVVREDRIDDVAAGR